MFSPEGFVLISCAVLLVVQPGHGSEIIGGKEVKPHSLPYMALLETAAKETENVKCHPLESPKTEPNWNQLSDCWMGADKLVDRKECSKYFSPITEAMICAGSKNVGTYKGDSGGPLLCNKALVGSPPSVVDVAGPP
ncbi:hypothetical protein D4764_05G0003940 [Takifugu flavidus]|uniref:Peptidase S1 domain-containing protein n=1 Tax=Takifugu flavidus TaxID=433684 RepID=A0A5C6MY72_9TELE|nr:hypothetical protein D4764_05G0003940 [Takifugu flavidus]